MYLTASFIPVTSHEPNPKTPKLSLAATGTVGSGRDSGDSRKPRKFGGAFVAWLVLLCFPAQPGYRVCAPGHEAWATELSGAEAVFTVRWQGLELGADSLNNERV